MELPLTYVIILLLPLNMYESAEIVYNKGTMERYFSCSNQDFPTDDKIIKLFLSSENLKIHCYFFTGEQLNSKEMLNVFTSGGLAPSMGIINSTYHGIFHFNLTLFTDQGFWIIDIPRANITKNTDIAAVEQWLVRITLHQGLNIYSTEGTLLDIVREPILQWSLGDKMTNDEIATVHPYVVDIRVTKCPCANDVALISFILNSTHEDFAGVWSYDIILSTYNRFYLEYLTVSIKLDLMLKKTKLVFSFSSSGKIGVYIGRTIKGFWNYNETEWFNMTKAIFSVLEEDHRGLTMIDMVLTNHFLIILTSLGLFISTDLRYPMPSLSFIRIDFCGFERVDYVKGKLWYNENCFANREHFEVDYATVTFNRNRTLSESSSCFYSIEPFVNWVTCTPNNVSKELKMIPSDVITFLIDQEHNTGIYLSYFQAKRKVSVTVHILSNGEIIFKPKFPPFFFPLEFSSPTGLVFHPRSHFLYAYGNQLWMSMDGGNTFELISNLRKNIIMKTFHSFYTSDIVFVSQKGKVYLTKAGLRRYSSIGVVTDQIYTLYYDQLGYIHKLTTNDSEEGGTLSTESTINIFGEESDMSFKTALVPQFTSADEVIFFAYVPLNESKTTYKKFSNIHFGKVILSSKTGRAYIRKVLRHDHVTGFLSSIVADLMDPFAVEEANESSCLSSSITISKASGDFYNLNLDSEPADATFQDSDIEKTVVLPGYSSLLITNIVDNKNALALATMPQNVPLNYAFAKGSWFMFNFGKRKQSTWAVHSKPCNYWIQQRDDSPSLNMVRYVDLGYTQLLTAKVMPNGKGTRTVQFPLVKVILGNPNLLKIEVDGFFDDTDSYLINVSVSNRFLHQGFTSLAMIVWGASTECFATTLLPMLKSSCSYLRAMHHIPRRVIPHKNWILGVYNDPQGFNQIKTLPVNYRPPSNMGIAIPLTDNFYHADPSKPIPRNLFHKSKITGKYKQCANVSTRQECNCTEDQKFSYAVAFSDCKEKVPRFKYPVSQYQVSLEIFSENGRYPVKAPYLVTVTEVNGRKNWRLRHTIPKNVEKMKTYLEELLHVSVFNPSGLNLSIRGSELFHFRVSVVEGVTFCKLVEEFQIYVDEVPLPFPGHTLIAVATAVVLGGLIFTAFMFQLRNIHPWKTFQRWIQRSKVVHSNTSVT